MTEIEKTGTDVLREAARIRVKTMRYAGLARDLGIAAETLVAFSENKLTPPPQILSALAKELWGGHVVFDPVTDLLRTLAPPTRPLGVTPPLFDLEKPSRYAPPIGPWTKGSGGITGLPPSPQARPRTRPGWAR